MVVIMSGMVKGPHVIGVKGKELFYLKLSQFSKVCLSL